MASRPQKPFEFPDGYNNSFGVNRYRLPELLYQPKEFLNVVRGIQYPTARNRALTLRLS